MNAVRKRPVHSALELMAHPLDAAAPEVNIVGSLRNHWTFDLDDPDKGFGDCSRADAARVIPGGAGILRIITEWQTGISRPDRRTLYWPAAKEAIFVNGRRMQRSF